MKTGLRFLLAGVTLVLAACSSNKESAEVQQQGNSFNIAHRNLSNSPAAAACSMAGGTLQLARQLDGTSVGMCQMSNGRRCGESAVMSGACT
ncbi:MAG: DUF333 domain-containing protein [Rouxiella badensis]|uniref:putative hemolysin n=1 Tax=Rouxiella badensis TaxID=1646377 RepID=UPI001787B564|nr:DUF333 domain-containing protein [Rouxiella badensis]QOI54875.1 DUF333 domain-containing protein [Rouxiella badensis subsp. acadiensis]